MSPLMEILTKVLIDFDAIKIFYASCIHVLDNVKQDETYDSKGDD